MNSLASEGWQLMHLFNRSSQCITIKMHWGWISSLNSWTLNNWLIFQYDLTSRNNNWLEFTGPAWLASHKLKIHLVYCTKIRDRWIHLCFGLSHGSGTWLLYLRCCNIWLWARCSFAFQNLISWYKAPWCDILWHRKWLLMFHRLILNVPLKYCRFRGWKTWVLLLHRWAAIEKHLLGL